VTSPSSTPAATPDRPETPADAALYDAVAAEHGVIYGYGLVSAHSTPDVNYLVSDAIAEHRARREEGIARLAARNVPGPLPAPGYEPPIDVHSPGDAAKLAVRMEEDAAVAWRAVLERADTNEDRAFAVTALTETAVTATKWRRVVGMEPSTVAFPGGAE
jgi:hypothetical protein